MLRKYMNKIIVKRFNFFIKCRFISIFEGINSYLILVFLMEPKPIVELHTI